MSPVIKNAFFLIFAIIAFSHKVAFAEISNGSQFLCEASLAFTREFWNERRFRDEDNLAEFYYFLQYRQNNIVDIPNQFGLIGGKFNEIKPFKRPLRYPSHLVK